MVSITRRRSDIAFGWTRAAGAAGAGAFVLLACVEAVGRVVFGVYFSGLPTAIGAMLSAYAFLLLADSIRNGTLGPLSRFGEWLAGRAPVAAAVRRALIGLLAAAVVLHIAVASVLSAHRIWRGFEEAPNPDEITVVVVLAQLLVAAGAALAAVPLLIGAREAATEAWRRWRAGPAMREVAWTVGVVAFVAVAAIVAHRLLLVSGAGEPSSPLVLVFGLAMAALVAGGLHAALVMVMFFPAIAGFDPDPQVSRIYLLGAETAIVPILVLLALAFAAAGMGEDLDSIARRVFRRGRTGLGLAMFWRNASTGAVLALPSLQPTTVARDVPPLVRAGYWPRTAVGLVAAATAFGPILPPSLLLALYGMDSHSGVFAFGAMVGILLLLGATCLLSLPGALRSEGDRAPPTAPPAGGLFPAIARVGVAPAIILTGVLLERITLDEAGALSVVAVMAIGLVRRRLRWRDVWPLLDSTARYAVLPMFILVAGGAYAWLLTAVGIPQFLAIVMNEPGQLAAGMAFLVAAILLLRWLELDAVSILMVLFPLWLPIMKVLSASLAPDRFGVLMLLAVQIAALLIPTHGHAAAVRGALGDPGLPMRRIAGAALPFALVALAVFALLAVASLTGM